MLRKVSVFGLLTAALLLGGAILAAIPAAAVPGGGDSGDVPLVQMDVVRVRFFFDDGTDLIMDSALPGDVEYLPADATVLQMALVFTERAVVIDQPDITVIRDDVGFLKRLCILHKNPPNSRICDRLPGEGVHMGRGPDKVTNDAHMTVHNPAQTLLSFSFEGEHVSTWRITGDSEVIVL